MKRILCFMLCVLTLVPLFALWPSAETTVDVVGQLQNYTIDGKPFDPNDYPLNTSDKGIYLLALRERGSVRGQEPSEWKNYKLDLYLYNPSGIPISDGYGEVWLTNSEEVIDPDTSGIGSDTVDSNATYHSDDNRFIRVSISYAAARPVGIGEKRIYHFFKMRFEHVIGTKPNETYEYVTNKTEYMFTVYGFESDGTMSYSDGQTRTMELELRGTVWRDENIQSSDNPYVYNEIPTVYFTIPSEIYNNYDRVAQIAAEFRKFHSTPIVVTNSAKLNSMNTAVLRSGLTLSEHWDDVPTLSYGQYSYMKSFAGESNIYITPEWVYNPSNYNRDLYNLVKSYFEGYAGYTKFVEYCNALSFYFYNPNIEVDVDKNLFYHGVTDDEFESYLLGYTQTYDPNAIQYSPAGISSDLYDYTEYFPLLYNYKDTPYEISDYTFENKWDKFWWALLGLDTGVAGAETVDKICEITSPAAVASEHVNNLDGLCDKYKIGKDDAASFLNYLQNADGVVVLLRLDADRYECRELDVFYTVDDKQITVDDGQTWLVRMNYYREVDVTEVTFEKDGKLTTYKVFADPININGGVDVKDDAIQDGLDVPKDAALDLWSKIKAAFQELTTILKWLGIIVVGGVLVFGVIQFLGLLKPNRVKVKYDPPDKHKRK